MTVTSAACSDAAPLPPESVPHFTGIRRCLLKRPANLTPSQKLKLKDLVRYNLQSVRAYLLKEDFQQLWNYESTTWAAKFLDQWWTCPLF